MELKSRYFRMFELQAALTVKRAFAGYPDARLILQNRADWPFFAAQLFSERRPREVISIDSAAPLARVSALLGADVRIGPGDPDTAGRLPARPARGQGTSPDSRHIRFHAILHDEVGLYNEDKAGTASLELQLRRPDLRRSSREPRKALRRVELHAQPAASGPPDASLLVQSRIPRRRKITTRWGTMIDAFVRHLLARYGAPEVGAMVLRSLE